MCVRVHLLVFMCVTYVHIPKDVKRGWHIPWSQSYRQVCVNRGFFPSHQVLNNHSEA